MTTLCNANGCSENARVLAHRNSWIKELGMTQNESRMTLEEDLWGIGIRNTELNLKK